MDKTSGNGQPTATHAGKMSLLLIVTTSNA